MNIIYLSTSFPKPDKGETIYTDLAHELKKRGHSVIVVVADQKKNLKTNSFEEENGIRVLRIACMNFYDVNKIKKAISFMFMPKYIKKGIKKYLKGYEFDFVLHESPPVSNFSIVRWIKKTFNCLNFLMLKDIFPQNAVDLQLFSKRSIFYHYYRYLEVKMYRLSDKIGVMSKGNLEYILKHNKIDQLSKKTSVFPNTIRVNPSVSTNKEFCRKSQNIPEDSLVLVFGGNMGLPQYIELLIYALEYFRDNEKVYFILIGRGTERTKIKDLIENKSISNIKLLQNLSRSDYENYVLISDLGIITLNPKFTIPNYPSRILSYFRHSLPVLAATDINTDIKELIIDNDLGYWVHSAHKKEFVKQIEKLIYDKSGLKEKGMNANRYLKEKFSVSISVDFLEKYYLERADKNV
ncbi:MAG: glycosyltransferase family 4 protein [Tenericutes bacterium]|nr:glycosyltransferase family 4 protein [Mycoplasmatota bacterium]